MDEFFIVILTGLATGVPFFLMASGLTLTFGVMRVMNMAHGAFFMMGAFLAATILGNRSSQLGRFVLVTLLCALFVAAIGFIAERLVFRMLTEEFSGLLASFGLLLLMTGLVETFWGGTNPRTVATPTQLQGQWSIGKSFIPVYDILLIAVGSALALLLHFFMRRTHMGTKLRAVADDPTMAAALGIRTGLVALAVFVIGAALAGIAGALMAPYVSIDSSLAQAYILQAFVVILIGGLGSVGGALVGSIILGLAGSVTIFYIPSLESYSIYIVFAVLMLVRPFGLFPSQAGVREA